MPMYLDRHDAPGLTPEQVSAAHELDLEAEKQFGVHYHTYWFDPSDGTVFCLAEGPSRDAVEEVHRVAHGEMASAIIELNSDAPLNSFLGPMPVHPAGTPYVAPAIRAIVFTDISGSVAQTHELGDDGHMQILRDHNEIVRAALASHGGREVKHTGDGIMASFDSVASAIAFSVDVQRAIDDRNRSAQHPLRVSIGMSAGEPVTGDNDDLFGAAVQHAARLCGAADAGEILASLAVRELSVGKAFRFEDRGALALKGMPEPAPTFTVAWRS